jgi:nicotinate-nucleotide adenylyltransferase
VSTSRAAWSHVGVFGGTFDPPHIGHLLAAGDAVEKLALDIVLWVPAALQPLKTGQAPSAAAEARLKMVELTIDDDPRFAVDHGELERGGLSFTVDTLASLRERYPAAELCLLVGEDSWRTFPAWRDPERIRELARVVVLTRDKSISRTGEPSHGREIPAAERISTRRIDVSATEIRRRVRDGLPIRGFVTERVEGFITERGLYR